jgi:hypothetical protein
LEGAKVKTYTLSDEKTYPLSDDDVNWVFGVKGAKHVWQSFTDSVFCSCICWDDPIGIGNSPLALGECSNCDGYGVPPVPWRGLK